MIASAARYVIGGGVIVYPTETVYGLGANALDEQAVMRVFQIKKRPLSKPIFLAVSNFEMLMNVAEVSQDDLELLKQLLPGPVSVLVRKKEHSSGYTHRRLAIGRHQVPGPRDGFKDHRSGRTHHLHQRQSHRRAATHKRSTRSPRRSRIEWMRSWTEENADTGNPQPCWICRNGRSFGRARAWIRQ